MTDFDRPHRPWFRALVPGLCFFLGLCLSATAGVAETPPPPDSADDGGVSPNQRLKELEHLLDQSRAEKEEIAKRTRSIADEAAKVRADMVSAAHAAQENEESISVLESQLAELTASEREKTEALKRRSAQMTGVLTALQRLAWRPTEALMAQPQAPADTVRSAILLRAAVPEILKSADELKSEIAVLTSLRNDIDLQHRRVAEASGRLEDEHKRLKELYGRKAQLQDVAEAAQAAAESRVNRLLAEAQDLRDLMARLEEERKRRIAEAEAKDRAEKAAREAELAARRAAHEAEEAALRAQKEAEQAQLRAAREQKERERAQADAAREAERRAQVEAKAKELAAQKATKAAEQATQEAEAARPVVGQSFAEAKGRMPFPARGRVVEQFNQTAESGSGTKGVTIETRADAQVIAPFGGQVVFNGPFRGYGLLLIIEHSDGYHTLLAGMSRIDVAAGQHLVAGEPVGVMGHDEAKPTLYVELRHNGQPVNPMPWLSAHSSKVHG